MSAVPNLPEDIVRPSGVFDADSALKPALNQSNDATQVAGADVKDDVRSNGVKTDVRTNGVDAEPQWQLHDTPIENQRPIRVIVIGAGYSGVYCGIRIPERMRNCELVIYEKNAGIGGTW